MDEKLRKRLLDIDNNLAFEYSEYLNDKNLNTFDNDKIVQIAETKNKIFVFFIDYSCLVIDDKTKHMCVVDTESIFHVVIDSFPFKNAKIFTMTTKRD
jgi:hypothetical protein